MTYTEFSDLFDVLYNNLDSNMAPSLDEYEKSVVLTLAQALFVLSLYQGTNTYFESDERVRRQLGNLLDSYTGTPTLQEDGLVKTKTYSIELPKDKNPMYITFELAYIQVNDCSKTVLVQPILLDSLFKVMLNPFRRADETCVLRIDSTSTKVELISEYPLTKYTVKFIKHPEPIIVGELLGVSINGKTSPQTCQLDESLHYPILELAVLIASSTYKK